MFGAISRQLGQLGQVGQLGQLGQLCGMQICAISGMKICAIRGQLGDRGRLGDRGGFGVMKICAISGMKICASIGKLGATSVRLEDLGVFNIIIGADCRGLGGLDMSLFLESYVQRRVEDDVGVQCRNLVDSPHSLDGVHGMRVHGFLDQTQGCHRFRRRVRHRLRSRRRVR
jgi:hypothetical protein